MHKVIVTCLLGIIINNVTSQYIVGPTIKIPSPQPTQVSKQQLINYLLSNSNQTPLGERLEVLATAVQKMPPKKNRRVYLADVLKQSAFQNLLVAASVCGDAAASSPGMIPEFAAPLPGYMAPLRRTACVANAPNQAPIVATALNQTPLVANVLNQSPLLANALSEPPQVANWDLLSTLLPRELLSSMVARDYALNRAPRYQYV